MYLSVPRNLCTTSEREEEAVTELADALALSVLSPRFGSLELRYWISSLLEEGRGFGR